MRAGVPAALVMGALFGAVPAWAGHSQEREGFWIGFGAGYGSASIDFDCDFCDVAGDGREGSVTGFLKLGGTLNESVLLGVETNAWSKDQGGARITLGNVSGTVTFYPSASSGFFLKAGAGVSYVDTGFDEGSLSVSLSKTGFGFLAGVGYDLRVGRNVSITPSVNYYYGKPGDIEFQGETALPNFRYNVFDFGVGVTFH
jgi:opacity protein-like surface antigen